MSYLIGYLLFINLSLFLFFGWIAVCIIIGKLQVTFTYFGSIVEQNTETADEGDVEVDTQLTPLEQERLRDMMEFDQRIAGLKDELARVNGKVRESYIIPDESDGVRNLPHQAVRVAPSILEIAD